MLEEELEEVLDADIYAAALKAAEEAVESIAEAWELAKPYLEEAEPKVREMASMLGEPLRDYRVAAVDSTFTPALALRGFHASVVVLARVLYPSEARPKFKLEVLHPARESEEEEASPSSGDVKEAEVKFMLEVADGGGFDVLVRDGDYPPVDALFPTTRGRRLAPPCEKLMEKALAAGFGLAGLVKRVRTALIAYRVLGESPFEEAARLRDRNPSVASAFMELLSDSVLGWLMLEPGECLHIGSYGDDVDGSSMIAAYFSARTWRKQPLERITTVLDRHKLFKRVEVAYYRPQGELAPLVKLTGFNLDLKDFAAYSLKYTRGPAYPDYINLADTACLEYARTVKPEDIMLLALYTASHARGLHKLRFRGRSPALLALQNIQKLTLVHSRIARMSERAARGGRRA
ncbi:MAG: hypothetical protein DRN99_07050 [Thermoproteota archaeon]|nr:MAG: hypothetical protein DRN99_07050 [Candidatus Korarchaeota archaeon]